MAIFNFLTVSLQTKYQNVRYSTFQTIAAALSSSLLFVPMLSMFQRPEYTASVCR